MMIRHMVLVRFKTDVSEAARERIMQALDAVVRALPGCRDFQALTNTSPESAMIKGYAHGFSIDFDDDVARRRYLDDPAHRAAGAQLVAASEGGVDGIVVFDYALAPQAHDGN